MVTEKSEPGRSNRLFPDLVQQFKRVVFACIQINSEHRVLVVMPDKYRVEQLAIAGQIIETVEAGLEKIGSGPHLCQDNEIVE